MVKNSRIDVSFQDMEKHNKDKIKMDFEEENGIVNVILYPFNIHEKIDIYQNYLDLENKD